MKKFKELMEELDEKKTMSLAQRKKAGLRMKKLAKTSSFQKKKEKKMSRMATKEDLMKRAMKAAKMKLLQKLTGIDKSKYMAMSPQERIAVDKKIESKSAAIKKLALKMIPVLKKQEMERISKMKSSKE